MCFSRNCEFCWNFHSIHIVQCIIQSVALFKNLFIPFSYWVLFCFPFFNRIVKHTYFFQSIPEYAHKLDCFCNFWLYLKIFFSSCFKYILLFFGFFLSWIHSSLSPFFLIKWWKPLRLWIYLNRALRIFTLLVYSEFIISHTPSAFMNDYFYKIF